MKKYKKVVLKIGSALISESNSTSSEMIKDLSSQISLLHHDTQFIIVTSGAISQGMNILGINDKPKDLESFLRSTATSKIAPLRQVTNLACGFGAV